MSHEVCPVCDREVPIMPEGSDVPIPFLREDSGQRWHVGCLEDIVLPLLELSPGQMAAIRVFATAHGRRSQRRSFTDEGT